MMTLLSKLQAVTTRLGGGGIEQAFTLRMYDGIVGGDGYADSLPDRNPSLGTLGYPGRPLPPTRHCGV